MGILKFKLPTDPDLLGCVAYHIAIDVDVLRVRVGNLIDQIDHLNNPDLDGIAPSDDEQLLFDLERLYKKLEEFQTKYKGELI